MKAKQNKNEVNNATGLQVINYSERSIAVVGDTKQYVEKLKELGGRYNRFLSCGAGWIFSVNRLEQVTEFVGSVTDVKPRKSTRKAAKADTPTGISDEFNTYYNKKVKPTMVKLVRKLISAKPSKVSGMGPSGSYYGGELGCVLVDYDKRNKNAKEVMAHANDMLNDIAKEFTASERRKFEIVPMLNQSIELQSTYYNMVVDFLKNTCGCKKASIKTYID